MATDAGILRPAKCVFIGLPIRFAIKHKIDIKKLLAAHKIPSLIIQNDQDPIGSFEEVSELISLLNSDDFEIQRLVGSNHDYEDYQAISRGVYKLIESES
jgi:predicted alpha/beta-hydrolase family hydrolase